MINPFRKNNLPPESQPWGRDVESRIAALELLFGTNGTKNDNTSAGLQASLQQLAGQVVTQVGTDQVRSMNSAGSAMPLGSSDFMTFNTATLTAPEWASHVILLIPTYTSVWLHSGTNMFSPGQTYCDAQVVVGIQQQGANPLMPLSVAVTTDYTANQALMATNIWPSTIDGGQVLTVQQQARKAFTSGLTAATVNGELNVIALYTRS